MMAYFALMLDIVTVIDAFSMTKLAPLKGVINNHPYRQSQLFAITDNVVALQQQKKASSKSTTTKQSYNKYKYNKQSKRRTKKSKNKYSTKQWRKQKKQTSKRSSTSNNNELLLTKDELKQLTEYHLSQNINRNGTLTLGDMSPQQLNEFARLISSWTRLQSSIKYSRQDKILAAEMAEQCLRELIEEKIVGNNIHLQQQQSSSSNNSSSTKRMILSPDLYHLVIKSWIHIGTYNELIHANSLLDLMERTHRHDTHIDERYISNSMKCYATVLDGFCKSKSKGSEVKAEEILHRMEKRILSGGGRRKGSRKKLLPVKYYNNVMNRIAISGKPNAGVEAERLLNDMISSYKNHVLSSNTSSNNSTATIVSSSSTNTVAPNRNSFNTVIKAYANAGGKHDISNVQRILSMMEDPHSFSELEYLPMKIVEQMRPDKITYTSVLMAYGKSNDMYAGEKAEELLSRMIEMGTKNDIVKPDTVTYNAVLKVWGKCFHPDAGERSVSLLTEMLQLYKDGDGNVIPDDVSFNTVIHNIGNSNAVDSPQRAVELLEQMEESYESGLIKAKPDIISYNSVLNAFAKRGGPESAYLAEEMLNNLEKSYDSGVWNIQPDVYSYNICISAWGNCGDANRAVALLDRMTSRTNEGRANLKPDVTTYNSVLHAWSQSSDRNAPVKALGLLEIMLRLYEGGDMTANPDVTSFTTVINAFSKSKFPRKARQTRDLLRRMKHLYDSGQSRMRPNVFVYAAVLNACAYTFGRSEEKEEALKVGIETYEELQSSSEIETNHVAYGSFIRLCRRLMPDDSRRNHFITRAFRQCCSDGQLGEYVVRQIRAVPNLYVSLLQAHINHDDGEVVYNDLPSSWTCNVKDRTRLRGR